VMGSVGVGTASPACSVHVNATDAITIPVGTTSNRPATGVVGMMRYNTTFNVLEFYNGSAWMTMGALSLATVPMDNLQLYLDASNYTSGTTWVDQSSNGNNATMVGTPAFTAGTPAYFTFNGTNAFNLQLKNTGGAWVHSISIWFRPTSLGTGGRQDPFQIGTGAGASLYSAMDIQDALSSTNASWYFYVNDTSFPNPFINNKWFHVVCTYAGGYANVDQKTVYVNGTNIMQAGTSTTPLGIAANALMGIAYDRQRAGAYYIGDIANLFVYNRVLTPAEVTNIFNLYRSRFNV